MPTSFFSSGAVRSGQALAFALVLAAGRFSVAAVENQVSSPSLSADEIVSRAVIRDDQLRASRTTLKCDRVVRTDKLDAAGKVTETATARTVVLPTAAMEYSTSVASAKAGTGASGGTDSHVEKINAVMSLRKLAPRYDMTFRGEELVRGQACYMIDYKPKATQPASSTREEKVVSNLRGRFWISKTDFSVVQSEGSLVSPVTLALVASVNQMDIRYRSQALPNGDTCPLEVVVSMAVKAPFYDFRQRQVTTEENWRPR